MSANRAAVLEALPLAAAAIKRRQLTAVEPRWKPLDYQVPPEDDAWLIWLLMGGRGIGKTDACASYLDRHVNGPACAPDFPGGHYPAIIAPTLGDAAKACVNGPSGLRAHNPSVRLTAGAGGLAVRWPNGAEGHLFGAHTPDDVERLRAGGNRCLAAETLVRTVNGLLPISEVKPGELVWTRRGLRLVLQAGITQEQARLWRLETDRGALLATADHEVLTARGWLPLHFLEPGDTIATWLNTSPIGASDSTACCTDTSSPAGAACCIGTSGSASAARSLTVGISITGSPTTRLQPTLSASNSSRHWLTSTNILEAGNGTLPEHGPHGSVDSREYSPVKSAGHPSGREERLARLSARTAAESVITPLPVPGGHTRDGCAQCAVNSSRPLLESPLPHAHAVVRRCSPTERVEPVYDLLVEHDHEFFAGDLVVANCLVWGDELAAWRYLEECWHHMRFGLRLGRRPHVVASTTPKPLKLLKALLDDPMVRVSRATTADNPHLPQEIRDDLYRRYAGTRLGRQELEGQLLEDVPGALWTWTMLEDRRPSPDLIRIVVAVDPAASAGEESDETGIVAAGKGVDGRGYVLEDRSCKLSPLGWAQRAWQAFDDVGADVMIAEKNQGGDMVLSTLKQVRPNGHVKLIHANRSKQARAQPVAALYEQDKVSHTKSFDDLEAQLTTWTPEDGPSPDRLDALVYALTELLLGPSQKPEFV